MAVKDYGYVVRPGAKTDAQYAAEEKAKMKELGLDTSKGIYVGSTLDRDVAQAKEIASSPHVKWNPYTNQYESTATPMQQDPNAYKNFLQLKALQESQKSLTGTNNINSVGANYSGIGDNLNTFNPSVDYGKQLTDYEARTKQLEEQRINAGIAGLQKAKQTALTGISAQRQQLPEQTRAGVTQTRVISDQARKQMRDYFAQRFGESASGSQAQADIAQNVAQQGAETQYNLQEQAQMAELARRQGDIESGYESDVASIRAGAQADTMANILARQQQLQGLEASQSLANQQLQYQEGLRTQEQQREDALKTIDRDYADLTAGINRIKNDNDPSNDWLIPYYETRRSEKLQTIEEQKKVDAETQRKEAIRIQEQQAKLERQAYDDAVRRWSSGIPLTASQMQMLGVKTATKPKSTSGGSKTPVKPLW